MPPKSKIRRRRKKKQSNLQNPIPDSQQLTTDRLPSTLDANRPAKSSKHQPKLSVIYVQEELETQEALANRHKSKENLRSNKTNSLLKSPNHSQQLQNEIDFFTNCIANVDHFDTPPQEDRAAIVSADQRPVSEPSDRQQLASSFVQIEDDPILQYWRPKPVEPGDSDIFIVKSQRVLDGLVGNNPLTEARNLSEDGIFEHSRPTRVSTHEENFLIARLLHANHPECVQLHNGKPKLTGLKSISSDGPFKSVSHKEFVPILVEPRPMHVSSRAIRSDETYELKVFIESILFDHTNEIDAERRLTQHITELYAQYRQLNQSNTVGCLEQKLAAIRQILTSRSSDKSSERDLQLTFDRRDLRNKLHREQQAHRNIMRTILEQWLELKEVRQKQGFTNTTLKLVIRTSEANAEDDQKQWDIDFNIELYEVLDESIQFYNKAKRDSNTEVARPDPDEIERMLHDIFVRSRRHPGEPIVWLELEHVTVADQAAGAVQSVEGRLVVQLIVNKKKKSIVRTVNAVGVRMHLNAELLLNVLQSDCSEQCKIVIFEGMSSKLLNRERIQAFVPLPKLHEIYQSSTTTAISFSSSTQLSGKLFIRIGWVTENCRETCSILNKKTTAKITLEPTLFNTLQAWYDAGTIDPMDPDASSLVAAIRPGLAIQSETPLQNTPKSQPHKMFRLNEDLTAFCSEETIRQDKRLNLLTARYNSRLQMKDAKYVPPTDREITEELEDGRHVIEDLNWMDPIEVHRHNGKKQLLHIYRTIVNHCDVLSKHSDAQDLLIGDAVPTFSSFWMTIRQLFSSNRPLNPQSRRPAIAPSLRSVSFKEQEATNFRIIVNVIRAQGVPYRVVEPRDNYRRTSGSSLHVVRATTVMPYVVVAFREKSCRTCTAEGSNPTWNEQLVIPVNGIPNLDTIKDTLHIELFDEHVEDLLDEDRSRANEIYQRISSRWLGDIRIPFYTILSSQRVEGTFEMNTPQLSLGYAKPTIETMEFSQNGVKNPEVRNTMHLTLFIHLEPVMAHEELNTTHLACTELPAIVNRVSTWLNEFREEFPGRCFDPLVTLSDGKRVCINRLVGAIDIPFERNNVAEFLVRRFVALVPILRNGAQCTKLNGVWLTNEQSITMLSVSAKDLGTMLVSYYLSLGFRAYVVIGFALPHGDTAFVLTKENGEFFLIDPTSGRKYSANDTLCPLVRVHAIVSGDNVWSNIQRESRVYMMHFNVAQSSEWRPLFGRSCAAPTGIVHNPAFEYRVSEEVFDLLKIIEWKVMKKISAWRPHRKTTWNRQISETMRQILVDLEDDVCFEYEPGAMSTYMDRLQETAGSYQVSGFPLNMRYVSLSDVVQRLKATGIHMNPAIRVEFGVAVHIQPYPCNVLSLWVFVIALVPKNL